MTVHPLHGGQLQELSDHFGIAASELLDFSVNINPEGPPPSVLPSLRKALDQPSILTSYPGLALTELRLSIARHACVRPECVSVANGFIPLLSAVLQALSVRRCLLPVPAFNEYRRTLERTHVKISPLELSSENGFGYDIDKLTEGDCDAILLANPQNPSGVLCGIDTITALLEQARKRNMYVLLDEAFIDYSPEDSAIAYTEQFPNLIVFRSVTKFYAIPGLRIAYVVASSERSAIIQGHLASWPVTSLASVGVIAALEAPDYAANTRHLNEHRRLGLRVALDKLGLFTYESAANFLLLRLPESIDATIFWERMIVEHRMVLRSCTNYETLARGHLRVAVRTSTENSRLAIAMSTLMNATRW